jgi:hypothetical protein
MSNDKLDVPYGWMEKGSKKPKTPTKKVTTPKDEFVQKMRKRMAQERLRMSTELPEELYQLAEMLDQLQDSNTLETNERIDELLGKIAGLLSKGSGKLSGAASKVSGRLDKFSKDQEQKKAAKEKKKAAKDKYKQNVAKLMAVRKNARKLHKKGAFDDDAAIEAHRMRKSLTRERLAAKGINLPSDPKTDSRDRGPWSKRHLRNATPEAEARVMAQRRAAKKRLLQSTELPEDLYQLVEMLDQLVEMDKVGRKDLSKTSKSINKKAGKEFINLAQGKAQVTPSLQKHLDTDSDGPENDVTTPAGKRKLANTPDQKLDVTPSTTYKSKRADRVKAFKNILKGTTNRKSDIGVNPDIKGAKKAMSAKKEKTPADSVAPDKTAKMDMDYKEKFEPEKKGLKDFERVRQRSAELSQAHAKDAERNQKRLTSPQEKDAEDKKFAAQQKKDGALSRHKAAFEKVKRMRGK